MSWSSAAAASAGLGFLNAGEARTLNLPLDLLPPGKTWRAMILSDDPTLKTRTNVRMETRDLTRESVLALKAAAHGGMAIRLHSLPSENP